MSIESLRKKFRTTGLDKSDCPDLLRKIVSTTDSSKLLSLIYMFGYSCDEDPRVMEICDKYIKEPVPGLTAVCMRVAIDYWNKWPEYIVALKIFLDLSIYDDWYDEVIFTVSYIHRNRHLPFPQEVMDRFEKLIGDPDARDLIPTLL